MSRRVVWQFWGSQSGLPGAGADTLIVFVTRLQDPDPEAWEHPKNRSTLGLCNLHQRSIRVQNWGFHFWILSGLWGSKLSQVHCTLNLPTKVLFAEGNCQAGPLTASSRQAQVGQEERKQRLPTLKSSQGFQWMRDASIRSTKDKRAAASIPKQ